VPAGRDTNGHFAMTPIKVVHLISADLWAGAEVSTYHAVLALAKRSDVQVSVVALNEGELCRRFRDADIRLQVLPEAEHSFLDLSRQIRKAVAACDIVHAHRHKENLLAALSHRPWVCTQHGRPEPFSGFARLRAIASGRLDQLAKSRSARRTIAVSSEIEEWLLGFLDRKRVALVWNGIADPAPNGVQHPWIERPLRVGVLGRLAPVKRVQLALAAIARCEGLHLEVVGDGPEMAALEDEARRLHVGDRVEFTGHLRDPLERVANWRALLVTSLHEGNPMSVLEALALGTPVICGRLPGVEEVLAGKAGWVVDEPCDAAAWARSLEAVSGSGADGSRVSRDARERFLSTFTSDRCAAQLVTVYREALKP
jgi:glycosyltransferase involved in cell wall biosynthesis